METAKTLSEAIHLLLGLTKDEADAFAPRTRAEQIAARIVAGAVAGEDECLSAVLRFALHERGRSAPAQSAPKITIVEEYGNAHVGEADSA